MGTQVFEAPPGFSFCLAELGVDDVSAYLTGLPKVDFVYCSPPNPDTISWWARDAGMEGWDYGRFFRGFTCVLETVGAREVHLEVGGSRSLVEGWAEGLGWGLVGVCGTTYAAPTTSRGKGMARTRRTLTRLSYGSCERFSRADTSDGFLDEMLRDRDPLVCFDPCIGRGLLSRTAIKYGHSCHGVDMSAKRLRAALAYVEDFRSAGSL